MKIRTSLFIVLIFTLALTACGLPSNPGEPTAAPSPAKVKVAVRCAVGLAGRSPIVVTGCTALTLHVKLAGVTSTAPRLSMARTWMAWLPALKSSTT